MCDECPSVVHFTDANVFGLLTASLLLFLVLCIDRAVCHVVVLAAGVLNRFVADVYFLH